MNDAASRARLFIGLWPDDAVRDDIVTHAQRWQWPAGARRVPRERLHITVHFLGSVPRERVASLVDAIDVPADGFDLRLARTAVWPRGIAVLCPEQVPDEALALHARLGEALRHVGHPPEERPWKPHVTLARDAPGAVRPPQDDAIAWRVQGFALVESMAAGGQQYQVLCSFGV